MATKSALYEYFWWIPSSEAEDERPTAFLLCQMSKKDRDIVNYRNEALSVMSVMVRMQGAENIPDRMKEMMDGAKMEQGFNEDMYRRCVKEIRNIYVKGEFTESITEPDEIITAIAGLVDDDISKELDDTLWNSSQLTEFESENFTPSSGFSSAFRTIPAQNAIENLTA